MDSSSPCPLDSEFSDQIAVFLAPPSPESYQDYYDELMEKTNCHGIRIKHNNKLGKGVYANKEFNEGELVLKDQMLVAAQHSSNKVDCLVCSHCFCYIGSIEVQIGRKLYLQDMGISARTKCDHDTFSCTSEEDCPSELLYEDVPENSDDAGSSACQRLEDGSLSKEVLESLMNGDLSLPYTKEFALPPVIACPGGCEGEHYCSKSCADSDWESVHSLLCTGESVESSRKAALLKFIEHANRTNDIFILAAKVISFTILKYKNLKSQHLEDSKQQITLDVMDGSMFSLLLQSWRPISMGFKRR